MEGIEITKLSTRQKLTKKFKSLLFAITPSMIYNFVRKRFFIFSFLSSLGFKQVPSNISDSLFIFQKSVGNDVLEVMIKDHGSDGLWVSYHSNSDANERFVYAHRYIVNNLGQLKYLMLNCARTRLLLMST